MGRRLPMPQVRPRQLVRRGQAPGQAVYFLPLRRVPHCGHAFPSGQVRPAQGVLYRLLRLDQQEGHHLDGARTQAGPKAEDLLGLQAQGHEGDEKFGEPPDNRYGGGGRNSVRGAGRGRSGQEERNQKTSGGGNREEEKRRVQTLCKGDIQCRRGLVGRFHEGPYLDRCKGDYGQMDGLRSLGKGFCKPGTDPLGQKGK